MNFKLKIAGLVLAVTTLTVSTASALITIDTVPVGNPGNANDSTGYGAVSYNYSIGKFEVTLDQYCVFLNAVADTDTYSLYNANMAANLNIAGISRSGVSGSYNYAVLGSASRPVTFVTWFDAARFVNWLQNGQPTGAQGPTTTERGAYTLNGAMSGIFTRNNFTGSLLYGLPSENEWYKAAYYQPVGQGGDTDNYWLYPTGTNAVPNSRNGSPSDPNSANFSRSVAPPSDGVNDGFAVTGSTVYSSTQNYLTDVGAFAVADSFYGTFDQGGNVFEWNDAVSGSFRGYRGGAWSLTESNLRSTSRNTPLPTFESGTLGFRIVMIPEPSLLGLLTLGIGMMLWRRRSA